MTDSDRFLALWGRNPSSPKLAHNQKSSTRFHEDYEIFRPKFLLFDYEENMQGSLLMLSKKYARK